MQGGGPPGMQGGRGAPPGMGEILTRLNCGTQDRYITGIFSSGGGESVEYSFF